MIREPKNIDFYTTGRRLSEQEFITISAFIQKKKEKAKLKRYKVAGDTGVVGYEFLKDGIIIEFKKGGTYYYNVLKPGKQHVDAMITLAQKGEGLSTYINKHVKDNYFQKLK